MIVTDEAKAIEGFDAIVIQSDGILFLGDIVEAVLVTLVGTEVFSVGSIA